MARLYPSERKVPNGKLNFLPREDGVLEVFFTPPMSAVNHRTSKPIEFKRRILELSLVDKSIVVYPIKVWGDEPMTPRYSTLSCITLSSPWLHELPKTPSDLQFLIELTFPPVLIMDYNFGLGFRREYQNIRAALESYGVKHLHILDNTSGFVNSSGSWAVTRAQLSKLGRRLDAIVRKARHVSHLSRYNTAREMVRQFFEDVAPRVPSGLSSGEVAQIESIGDQPLRRLRNLPEQTRAIKLIEENGKQIFKDQPDQLIRLRNNIDLMSLEGLIDRFQEMMAKPLHESNWQTLFKSNPFILTMAFGISIVAIQDQAYVGGQRLSGGGSKIADFLVKNSITGNAAVVEIKKPSTPLMSKSPYRSDVFGPSADLAGGLTQVLDQIQKFQRNVLWIKDDSRINDLESFAVSGILIAGRMPMSPQEQRSFELFRGNSKSVSILTFDELFEKLKALHSFLLNDLA